MRKIKKYGLFTLIIFALFCLFTCGAAAEEMTDEELYKRQYETSGAAELKSSLPKETSDLLGDIGFDLSDPNEIFRAETDNILSDLGNFLTE